jgi:hypothetical protein
MIESFIIVTLIFSTFIYIIIQRALEVKKLAESGVPINGRIVNKIKTGKGRRSKFIRYEYTTPRGQLLSRSSAVTDSVWSQYNEGDPIELVYLENSPKVCGPKYMIDQAKEALIKK